jgi:ubiquitin-conjugating enzyme (huntingtin interacting protein 2)
MASNMARRIAKELADLHADTQSHIQADTVGDDITKLRGSFGGPPGTPYEGGKYEINIDIPSEYPFRPPIMKFATKVWHPNVSSQTVSFNECLVLFHADNGKGAICVDTLSTCWSPVLTIKSALISLQSLLSSPEPKDPQDAEVAQMLIKNPKEFERVAREWAVRYAGAPKKNVGEGSGGATAESIEAAEKEAEHREQEANLAVYEGYNKELIDRFVNMGFDVDRVVAAFKYVGIDRMGGEDYELEEAYMGDITARLLGEP